jgi:hypothetical protein
MSSHFNFDSLSVPEEAKPKRAKPKGHTDDSHVKEFLMPNPANTKPTRLNDGESYGQGGQLDVKNFAERVIEIVGAPENRRPGMITALFTDYGTLNSGSGEAGDRPHYDHRGEPEIFAGDSDYSAGAMDAMKPIDHVGWASTALDDISGCDACDDGKCEECRGNFRKAMAHLSRFAEKVGEPAGDGDEGERDVDAAVEEAKRIYAEKAPNTAELERDAVRISSNASIKSKPGQGHFSGFPSRKV